MIPGYRIVVCSRKRTHNMPTILELLPNATVLVHESEREDYLKFVPEEQLATHDKLGISRIRQYALDCFPDETIVFIDDDFKGVRSLVGERPSGYADAESIKQIVENAVNTSKDLGIDLFYWNRIANPMQFNGGNPFYFCAGYAGGAFGVNRRLLSFDQNLSEREDVDITLLSLLKNRKVLIDNRLYFQFGNVNQGTGGLQGLRSSEATTANNAYMKRKWGKWITLEAYHRRHVKVNKNRVTGTKVNVVRKQSMVGGAL